MGTKLESRLAITEDSNRAVITQIRLDLVMGRAVNLDQLNVWNIEHSLPVFSYEQIHQL